MIPVAGLFCVRYSVVNALVVAEYSGGVRFEWKRTTAMDCAPVLASVGTSSPVMVKQVGAVK